MGAFVDITGNRYGRLVVLKRLPNKNGKMRWLCHCDCGNTTEARGEHLKNLKITSCGCYQLESHTKHGRTHTPEYASWHSMKDRCLNPNSPAYEGWGGRGITICPQWINSFEQFYADMGPRPEGMTLDRRDNEGHYTPDNCRWATGLEQVYNRRNTIKATIDGITKPIKTWCAELRIVTYHTALKRVWAGWAPEHAVTRPPHSLKCIVDPNSNSHWK